MDEKYTESPVKEKFWTQRSVKKIMLTVFWDIKEPIATDFLEEGATIKKGLPTANPFSKIHFIY